MISYAQVCVTNADRLISKQGGYPEGWDVDRLNRLHSVVAQTLSENSDKIDGRWSVTFAELCRIIQQERAQAKYERDFAHYLKMKQLASK